MTNLQALQGAANFCLDVFLLSKILLDEGVDETANYTADDKDTIDICAAYVAKYMYATPDTKEGSLSRTFDRDALLKFANGIFTEHGLTDEIITKSKISFI